MTARISLFLSVIALMGILALPATAQASAKETPLLSVATKVATLNDIDDETYFWVSDHQVLFFRYLPVQLTAKELKSFETGEHYPKDYTLGYYEALLCDTNTGKTTPLDQFNKRYATLIDADPMIVSTGGEPGSEYTAHNLPSCTVSPDGQWFLWSSDNMIQILQGASHKPLGRWIAAKLDGSAKIVWPSIGPDTDSGDPYWENDKHNWVELYETYTNNAWHYSKAIIYDLGTMAISRTIAMDSPENGLVEGVDSDGALLVVDLDFYHQETAPKIEQFDLSGASATRKVFAVQPPAGYPAESDAALSPTGDKLAWIFENRDTIVGSGTYLLCTSGPDGSHMQAIGLMQGYTAPKEVDHRSYYWPETLRWLPDGKHISFIFHGALYVVPAP